MECTIKRVYKNSRYRLVLIDNEYYLIDLDEHKSLVMVPFLFYFYKHKLYKVKEDDAKNLMIPDRLRSNAEKLQSITKIIPFIGVATSQILAEKFNVAKYFDLNIYSEMKMCILVLMFALCILLRIDMYYIRDLRTDSIIREGRYVNVKFKVMELKKYVNNIILNVFNLMMIIVGAIGFLDYGNLFMLGASVVGIGAYIIWNRTIFSYDMKNIIKFK